MTHTLGQRVSKGLACEAQSGIKVSVPHWSGFCHANIPFW